MFYSIASAVRVIFLLLALGAMELPAKSAIPSETAAHASGYIQWVFDVTFSPAEQVRYNKILADMWRGSNKGAIEAVKQMADMHQRLDQIDATKREQLRVAVRKELLALFAQAEDEDSRWLLSVYQAAHPQGENTPVGSADAQVVLQPAPQTPGSSTASPSAQAANQTKATGKTTGSGVLGRWTDGRVSSIQYQNAYTGVAAPTNGSSFLFEFRNDGTYTFRGLIQTVMYNCTTTIFSNETGNYTLSGNTLSLDPKKNPYKLTNSCASSSNKESDGKLIPQTYRIQIVNETGRRYLELTAEDGSTQKLGEEVL